MGVEVIFGGNQMEDTALLRHARHVLLSGVGLDGQAALSRLRVLLVGAGGLGSHAALSLSGAGIAELTVLDPDRVELSNLPRQRAYCEADVGRPKVEALGDALRAREPHLAYRGWACAADARQLPALLDGVDVVLDASDNAATRQTVQTLCWRHGRPLVFASVVAWDGQVALFDPAQPQWGCWSCALAHTGSVQLPPPEAMDTPCAVMGVWAPLVAVVAQQQAALALQWALHRALGEGHNPAGRLFLWDARHWGLTPLHLRRRPGCPVCDSPTPQPLAGRCPACPGP